MSVRGSSVFQKKVQKISRVLFKDTTTIMSHKHQLYGSMNQLNGSAWFWTFNLSNDQIKPIM